MGLGVDTLIVLPIILFCENNRVAAQSKELKNHHKIKIHIEEVLHVLWDNL